MKKSFAVLALAAIATLVSGATDLSAQTIYGCYVKNTGTMYRIKAEGAPPKCSADHTEFAWNAEGVPGSQGLLGIQGITTRDRLGALPNMGTTDFLVECKPGEYAIGGGFAVYQNPSNYLVRINAPSVNKSTGVHAWRVLLQSTAGQVGNAVAVVAYAICLATSNP